MSSGIALPAWIVDRDNSHLVLGAYVFTFMLCLPTWVGCWWYNRTKYYSDDVMLQTMKIFGTYIHAPFSIMYANFDIVLGDHSQRSTPLPPPSAPTPPKARPLGGFAKRFE